MKLLEKVDAATDAAIRAQFPEFKALRENEEPRGMGRVAISIFDHWLRDEREWHLFDCYVGPERVARDRKFHAHWEALFLNTTVYTPRYRGRWKGKHRLVIKRYNELQGYLRHCRLDIRKAPSQFVLLPEFDCIYASSWDDTNVLYFNDRSKAEPVLQLAREAGLYCLEYEA